MRSLWRGVKNTFYNYDEGECLIRNATSKDAEHPTPEELRAVCRFLEYPESVDSTLGMLVHRLMDLNQIVHVEKSLKVIEHVCKFGDKRVLRQLTAKCGPSIYKLRRYQYWSAGEEHGKIIRATARALYELLTVEDALKEFRGEVISKETPLPRPPRRQKSKRKKRKKKKEKSKRNLKIPVEPVAVEEPIIEKPAPVVRREVTPPPVKKASEQPVADLGWDFMNAESQPSVDHHERPLDLLTGPSDNWVNDFIPKTTEASNVWRGHDKPKLRPVLLMEDEDAQGWVEGTTILCSVCGFDNPIKSLHCVVCQNALDPNLVGRRDDADLSVSNLFSASTRKLLTGKQMLPAVGA